MKDDLIERYIYAVTKRLPLKIREDVKKELNTIIDDMLEERCGDIKPNEKDIKVVLTELGTPSELSLKYSPDSGKQLIGGTYFPAYKLILTIVLISIAGGLVIAESIATIVGDVVWYEALFNWFGSIIAALACGFTVVTIIFAVFERKGIAVKLSNDSLDELPPVPLKNQEIKKSECIIGMVFTILFGVYFIAMPGLVYFSMDGIRFGYLFDPEYVRSLWYLIVAIAVIGIIKESIRLFEGRYTKKLALGVAICNLFSGVLTFLFLWNDKIVNPQFGKFINALIGEDLGYVNYIFIKFNWFILIIIVFSLLLDTVVTVVKSLRYDK